MNIAVLVADVANILIAVCQSLLMGLFLENVIFVTVSFAVFMKNVCPGSILRISPWRKGVDTR